MAFNSADVVAGDTGAATQYNQLRQDVREGNIDTATRYLAIGIHAWQGLSAADAACVDSSNGYLINADAGFVQRFFVQDIHLPHGAIITGCRIYYYRKEGDLIPTFARTELADNSDNGITDSWSCIDTSETIVYSDAGLTSTISYKTIDNSAYRYRLYLSWDNVNSTTADIRVYGVIITYTVAKALP